MVGRTYQVSASGIGCRIACVKAETGNSSAIGIRRTPQRGAGRRALSRAWACEGRSRKGPREAERGREGTSGAERGRAGPSGTEGGRVGPSEAEGGRAGPTGAKRDESTPAVFLLLVPRSSQGLEVHEGLSRLVLHH